MSHPDPDVLIVGAGPTGLLLAGDLAARGVAVTVLERRSDESNLTRAFAVHARTLELLDARGLADRLIATGQPLGELRIFGDVAIDLSRLPSRFPFLLVTPQYETEALLEERAKALGAELVTGAEVVGLHQDADGVEVEVRDVDGSTQLRRAGYLVGADGVRSTVRHALGLPFPGHSAVQSVMLADVRLATPPRDVLTVNGVRDGFAFIAPFGDGWYRVIAWDRHRQLPDDAPVGLDEIRTIVRKALGTDYGMHDPRWLSRFHSDERQAPHYRVGRVFLAGDAAHVHSPAGGQGMNVGLQDAANLGWKLAAVVNGHGSDRLLDSYEAERYPVGTAVLRGSGTLLRLAQLRPWVLRKLRNVVAGRVTRIPPAMRRVAGAVSGVGVAYPAPRGAHPRVGKRAPDVPLAPPAPQHGARGVKPAAAAEAYAPTRLYEALRSGRFVLVTSEGGPSGWADRLDVVAPARPTATTMLVRPDGYVAWAADRPDQAGLTAALTEWVGGGGQRAWLTR